MSSGASNSYLVTTRGGDVLINTGLGTEAPVHKRCFEQASRNPIRYILLTQGHVDHVGGTDILREPGTLVVAQANNPEHQAYDARLAPFRARRSMFAFGATIRALRLMRSTYGAAAAVVGNSQGVVEEVARITGLPASRLHLIRNPVVTPDLADQAAQPLDHPWAPGEPPLILGIGGLRRQKGFDTLLRAFARARAQRPCRLLILGEGHLREDLLGLAAELGVAADFALPGFDPNPYRYLARAAMLVLSSPWQGSPNALTEALALGVPVVATDCPSGPREILAPGAIAPLVPVDDVAAMAAAILQVLDQPGEAALRRAAVEEYRVETCAARYQALLERLLEAEAGRSD